MAVTVKYDTFRFSNAKFVKPRDNELHGYSVANDLIAVCNDLVRNVARAGWDIPDVDVEIRYYGSGTNVLKHCSRVSFDVSMADGSTERATISYYGKAGPQVGSWNQLGAANSFELGDLEINLHDDGSGDWKKTEKLRAALEIVYPVVERLGKLPAKDGYLVDHLEGDLNLREICTAVPTPAPEDFPTLYVWVERNEAVNALGLYRDYNDEFWAKDNEYRLRGNGYRFVSEPGISLAEMPKGAFNGYDYASTDINERPRGLSMGASDALIPVEVKLKALDDIYVADFAPYENAKAQAMANAKAEGRRDWEPGEYNDCVRKSLATFVPAAEYKGGYAKPVYMIGRQLQADEALGMAGKISVDMDADGFVTATMYDKRTGMDVILYEGGDQLYHKKRAVQAATDTARILRTQPKVAPEITEAIEAHHARLRAEYSNDKTMQLLIG